MFKTIYTNELKKNLTSAAFYIFALLLVLAAYLNTSNVQPGAIVISVFGKAWHNAPLFLAREMAILSVVGILFTIKIVGRSVVQDFQANIHDLYFTVPMSKAAYLGGRFFASLTANILIYLGVVLGVLIACSTIDSKFYGPHQPLAYLFALFVIAVPNLLFIASLFFCFATLSRKMILTYMAGVGFLMLYGIAMGGLPFSEHETARALADPFGIMALNYLSKYWTVADINNNLIPFDRLLVLNRIVWFGCSGTILLFTVRRFKFLSQLEGRKEKKQPEAQAPEATTPIALGSIPPVTVDNSLRGQTHKCFHLAARELKRIICHPAFILITVGALAQVGMNFMLQSTKSQKYPLTSTYLGQASDVVAYMWPITLFFCGVIVWRERDDRSNELYDTLAVPDGLSYLSKLLAIMGLQFLVVILLMLQGIFLQVVVCGYTDIELGLYLKTLLGIDLVSYWQWAVLFLFIQNLASNKYLGFLLSAVLLVALFVGIPQIRNIDTSLLRYGFLPDFTYSNLTGFGHFATVILWYRMYWLLFGGVLMIVSALLWRRNNETRLTIRTRVAWQGLTGKTGVLLTVVGAMFVLTGVYIFYNNHILNEYMTDADVKMAKANYEKRFKQYDNAPQPDITDVSLKVDIFPEERNVFIEGEYLLKNNTETPINDIFVFLSEERITHINILRTTSDTEEILVDAGFHRFKLDAPMLPGDETRVEFDYEIVTRGFSISNPKNELAHNGTYLSSISFETPLYFPVIGYDDAREMQDDRSREVFGLPEKHIPTVAEYAALNRRSEMPANYEAIISTNRSQTAITNGKLVRSWAKNGRKYFHYRSETPMNRAFAILSGQYEVQTEKYEGKSIEVYYDKKHPYNVPRMINGIKSSYDYCTSNYSPYPHSVIRVVEVPEFAMSSGTVAFSLPTLFMWREIGGFISNVEDPEAVDYVFHITAHEMAHQWWAHTVKTAIIEGGGLPAETLARWVEVMCLEKEYGPEKARTFLEDDRKRYLVMRKNEMREEQAIVRAHFQGYLMYSKGCLAMHALKEYIGEDNVNAALRRIVERFPLEEPTVASANDIVAELRAVTPEELQYLITDLFETITLHENKAVAATYAQMDDGKYKVKLTVSSRKVRADGHGNETEVPLEDVIFVGVLDENDKDLYLKKQKMDTEQQTFEILVDEKPFKAGIDPHFILIDRNSDDNIVEVKEMSSI